MSQQVDMAEKQITDLQNTKRVLLELNKFEARVAKTILNLTNSANQDDLKINSEIASAREYFSRSEQWQNIGKIDSELAEIVSEFQSTRLSILDFINKVEAVVQNPKISIKRRAKKIPTAPIAVIALNNQELSQRVVRVESKIKALETSEIQKLRSEAILRVAISFLSAILFAAGFGFFAIGDILRRIRRITEKAFLASGGEPLPAVQHGRDELARLEETIQKTSELLSERRRKELALLDNAADVILTVDNNFKIGGVSPSASTLWRYQQDELMGKSILTLLPSNNLNSTIAEFIHAELIKSDVKFENVIITKDGGNRQFMWDVQWRQDDQKFYCVAHDVTEKRAIEKLKQQFASMVSHDLRAPITSIGLSLDLLIAGRKGEVSDALSSTFQKNKASAGRLVALVNQLLELDRLEAGKTILNQEFVSASEICIAAKEDLEAMANSANVSVKGPHGDAVIFADEGRIAQAVKNLLSNAIKFSPAGSTVNISVIRNLDFVEIRILDQGPGIAKDKLPMIFDRFQRSQNSENVKIKGSGLGLAIVKGLVEAQHGTVGAQSELGAGSTFWISLPAALETDADE